MARTREAAARLVETSSWALGETGSNGEPRQQQQQQRMGMQHAVVMEEWLGSGHGAVRTGEVVGVGGGKEQGETRGRSGGGGEEGKKRRGEQRGEQLGKERGKERDEGGRDERGEEGAKGGEQLREAASARQLRYVGAPRRSSQSTWRSIQAAFLPEGYPDSVTDDYLEFQIWDTLQGLSTYIRSMLSTQVLLAGFGVGSTAATAVGATFQWFIRDFAGMMGGILFTLFKGSNLDSNAKQWRLAADIINDVGMLLDLLSPLCPPAFLLILCLGSISRAITGTASGATRAALTQHFARRQNAADISAKEGSQETMATMVGMLLGMFLGRLVSSSLVALWLVFLSLTAFHVYANYRAVASLRLTSINRARTAILLVNFRNKGIVLSPATVSRLEPILSLPLPSFLRRPSLLPQRLDSAVQLGANLKGLVGSSERSEFNLSRILQRYGQGKYLLIPSSAGVKVVIHRDASPQEHLAAFVHAMVLAQELGMEGIGRLKGEGIGSKGARGEAFSSDMDGAQIRAFSWMRLHFSDFMNEVASSGWALDRVILAMGSWRATWLEEIATQLSETTTMAELDGQHFLSTG